MRLSSTTRTPCRSASPGQPGPLTRNRSAFALVIGLVEPPAGIEPATPSLPWNHREPLCGTPFSQLTPDRRGQSYRFSFGEVMCSLFGRALIGELSPFSSIERSRSVWRITPAVVGAMRVVGVTGSPPRQARLGSLHRRPRPATMGSRVDPSRPFSLLIAEGRRGSISWINS
jgi:hypothetical protein